MAKQKTRTKDYTAPDIAALEAEKRRLYVSGDNHVRLEKIKAQIDFFNHGIIMKKILLLLIIITAASCGTKLPSYNIVQTSVLLNGHEYKYGYKINNGFYKSNTSYKIGDTLPNVLPNDLNKRRNR